MKHVAVSFHGFLQVSGLEEGETYVFRVRAVNVCGVGKPSQVSDPVCAKALPGNGNQARLTAPAAFMLTTLRRSFAQ